MTAVSGPHCPPWCTRTHPDGARYLAHSGVVAERQADDGAVVQVRASWSQQLGRRSSVLPHIQIRRCTGEGPHAVTIADLAPGEALTVALVLEGTGGGGWLSEALHTAAGTLLDDQEEEPT